MPEPNWLELVLRWAHILAAITAMGGTIFARFAVVPVLAGLPEEQRRTLHEAIRARWAKFVHGSIAVLLATGLYNFMFVIRAKFTLPPAYHMIFGIKFLVAMILFFFASVLFGRSALAQKFRQNAKLWLTVNLALATTIVCLSGYLRALPHTPKAPADQVAPVDVKAP